MSRVNKTLTSHNLHNLFLEVEALREDGWKINKSIAVRRSLGNRYSVALVKEDETIQTEQVAQEVEVVEDKVEAETPQAEVKKRNKRATKTETEVEVVDSLESDSADSGSDVGSGGGE